MVGNSFGAVVGDVAVVSYQVGDQEWALVHSNTMDMGENTLQPSRRAPLPGPYHWCGGLIGNGGANYFPWGPSTQMDIQLCPLPMLNLNIKGQLWSNVCLVGTSATDFWFSLFAMCIPRLVTTYFFHNTITYFTAHLHIKQRKHKHYINFIHNIDTTTYIISSLYISVTMSPNI
jgi:hypothetical protein